MELDRVTATVPSRRLLLGFTALVLYAAAAVSSFHSALLQGEVLSGSAYLLTRPAIGLEPSAVPTTNPILGDSVQCFVPWMRYAADMLHAEGAIPFWKTTALCGAPLLGNGQSALFFPLQLLSMALNAPPWIHGAIAAIKVVCASWFLYLLARHLGFSFAGALLAGFVYSFAGFNTVFLLYPLTNVSMLLPLLLLATDRAAQRPSGRRVSFLALVCALQHLGGHPETAFHSQVLAFVLGLARTMSECRQSARFSSEVAARSMQLATGFVIGALVGAIQILPQLEYIRQSESLQLRSQNLPSPAFEQLGASALFVVAVAASVLALRRVIAARSHALLWGTLLFVSVLVGVATGLLAGMKEYATVLLTSEWFGGPRQYVGTANYTSANGAFLGAVVPLALLGIALGKPRRLVRALGLILALGLLVGLRAPLFTDLVDALPVFNLAANERLQLFAVLAASLLSAAAIDVLQAVPTRSAGLAGRILLALSILITAGFLGFGHASLAGRFFQHPILDEAPWQQHSTDAVIEQFALTEDGRWMFSGHTSPARPPISGALLFGTKQGAPLALHEAQVEPDQGESVRGHKTWVFTASLPASWFAPQPVRVMLRSADGSRFISPILWPGGILACLQTFPALPFGPRAGWQIGLLLLTTLLMSLTLRAQRPLRSLLCGAIGLLVLASLATFAYGFHPALPQRLFYPSDPAISFLQEQSSQGRVLVNGIAGLAAEVPTYYGIRDVSGYDALHPRRTALLLQTAFDSPHHQLGLSPPVGEHINLRLLGLMSVRYLDRLPSTTRKLPSVTLETLGKRPLTMFENPAFLPRARVVAGAICEPDDQRAIARLVDPTFDPKTTVVLESGEDRPATTSSPGVAKIESERSNRLLISAIVNERGWLVVSDTHFPGWRAFVDGREARVLRANVAFRAVALEPGKHTVEFRYEPRSFHAGLILALVGITSMLVLVLRVPSGTPARR